MSAAAVYPIGYVSLTTGLSAHVLRAWERRYAAVKPSRSASGRRLYSQEDIDRLVLLQRAVTKGHSISQIAGLDVAELTGLAGFPVRSRPKSTPIDGSPTIDKIIDNCLRATADLDDVALHTALRQAELYHSRKTVIEAIIVPFMEDVGRKWRQGELRIAHERLSSGAVSACLNNMLARNPVQQSPAPRILVAAPAGQHCPLGALAVGVIAQDCGWHPVLIGSDVPMEDIASAGIAIDPQLIALSLTCRLDDHCVDSELRRFGKLLAKRCPFVVGGAASDAHRGSIEEAGGALCVSSDELVERFL